MKKLSRIIYVFCTLLVLLFAKNSVFANAAQPGIWNAGGTVFTMLYPEDSLTFKKVQMRQEHIYIQLYKGFAVVKGTYLFRNTTGEQLRFKMGYPVNGIYSGGDYSINQITLDSLSQFKIKAGGNRLPLLKEPNTQYENIRNFSKNWMVWEMTFDPNENQTVEVYFIVNTNQAKVTEGYKSERTNAFIYLLESGSVWHQSIEEGKFYIQLMDGLTPKDVQGLSSGFEFQYNETHRLYYGTKNNFSPTPIDNLIITYYQYNENFSFENAVSIPDNLFTGIENLSRMPLENLTYTKAETGDPYRVGTTFGESFSALLTLFVISAPFIIGAIAVGIAIWAVVKWNRIRRRKKM
ncbi:hypothetical protein [Flavobacterium sp. MK4S-17]|uniref:hypothetical protein n=1 Tax=Flavobacterium sp. MK4S-17 TaxID=2543737 RepID=UPI00135869A8|nr:hypothetical protein [Flavobacterium sp. MK4S-17]